MAEELAIKRLRYFNHQFLRVEDFQEEQDYHLRMRRRLNRVLHTWGVAEGLQVTAAAFSGVLWVQHSRGAWPFEPAVQPAAAIPGTAAATSR